MERIDIMTDIETLGHKTDSSIIQIAAVQFDIETGEVSGNHYYSTIDITKNDNLKVTGSTLKWWINTDTTLFKEIINTEGLSEVDALTGFHNWIGARIERHGKENVYLWGKGILFDNKMIQHQFESIGLDYPIFYRNDRDVRTLIELASKKLNLSEKELLDRYKNENLVVHNAFDDVIYQISLAVGCYKELIK